MAKLTQYLAQSGCHGANSGRDHVEIGPVEKPSESYFTGKKNAFQLHWFRQNTLKYQVPSKK